MQNFGMSRKAEGMAKGKAEGLVEGEAKAKRNISLELAKMGLATQKLPRQSVRALRKLKTGSRKPGSKKGSSLCNKEGVSLPLANWPLEPVDSILSLTFSNFLERCFWNALPDFFFYSRQGHCFEWLSH